MFTGLIQHVGQVRAARAIGEGKRLTIDVGPLAETLAVGDSLAVDGACLTACAIAGSRADFDVSGETLSRTTLATAGAGNRVNLERPLRLNDELGGHLVQGHVDGVASTGRVDRGRDQWRVEFAADRALTDEMVPKGSVAVAGVSLTLTHVGEGAFSVSLIPTTVAKTTLADLAVGSAVNIETDVLGKYVRRYLSRLADNPAGGLTLEKLRDAGFA